MHFISSKRFFQDYSPQFRSKWCRKIAKNNLGAFCARMYSHFNYSLTVTHCKRFVVKSTKWTSCLLPSSSTYAVFKTICCILRIIVLWKNYKKSVVKLLKIRSDVYNMFSKIIFSYLSKISNHVWTISWSSPFLRQIEFQVNIHFPLYKTRKHQK